MKYRLFALTLAALLRCMAVAQTFCEQIVAYTDKDCYLAGERLCVRVDAKADGRPSPSAVAYVEVSDTHQMVAQCMVALSGGQGWAEIALPNTMHSGCYQLTAYTRAMRSFGTDTFFRSIIGVVNGERLSRRDDVVVLPYDSLAASAVVAEAPVPVRSYAPGQEVCIALPEAGAGGWAVAVRGAGVATELSVGQPSTPAAKLIGTASFMPEVEGHIVTARMEQSPAADVDQTRLALIGKKASLYDGQRQADGSYRYYTSDVYGNLPVMVNAFDTLGHPVRLDLVSPYAAVLPEQLPQLKVYCEEDALRQRATEARRQAVVNQWLELDTLSHSVGFMSAEPDFFYDLDEWTQMNDVRELLYEFVRGARWQKRHGMTMLYTFDVRAKRYSRWPALVLLDGIPIYDIDEILGYDAHLIRYVQIYSGIFNFGQSCCCGIISFVTRRGRLSNYQLKAGELLVSYAFPQNRPAFVNRIAATAGTLLWLPSVCQPELRFVAPSEPGRYLVTIQGQEASGGITTKDFFFEVTL